LLLTNLLMGTGGKNLSSKVPYFESTTLICLFAMQLLWGYDKDKKSTNRSDL